MPKQNRVTPFGELIADPARGSLTGNRGCLHDERQQIVRHHLGRRWIICQLQFKDYHRQIMTPGRYTELFFLDEAAALAAGHRPCAECSRPRFEAFRSAWAGANPDLAGNSRLGAAIIDAALHAERVGPGNEKLNYPEKLGRLPDGVFVTLESGCPAYLVWQGDLKLWTPAGYTGRITPHPELEVLVLTPRSIVRAIAAGFQPQVHPSTASFKKEHF
jgi:hypothetical protein